MKSSAESSSGGLGSAIAVRWRVALLVGALLGLSLGLALGRLSDRPAQSVEGGPGAGGALHEAAPALPGEDASARGGTAATSAALDAAAAERVLLRAELELLREEVDALRLALSEGPSGAPPGAPAIAPLHEPPGGRAAAAPPGQPADRPWFDDASLVRAGFAPSEVEELRERWERFELDKLYIADQTARRRAAGEPPQRGEVAALQAEFRAEVGEEGYDAYLYAIGQDNRVVVGEVLQSSPAMSAGLERGDVLLRYEGERIFRPRELQLASRKGVEGEVVRLEVLRDGRTISFTLSRGPLGIRLEAARLAPQRY